MNIIDRVCSWCGFKLRDGSDQNARDAGVTDMGMYYGPHAQLAALADSYRESYYKTLLRTAASHQRRSDTLYTEGRTLRRYMIEYGINATSMSAYDKVMREARVAHEQSFEVLMAAMEYRRYADR